MFSVTLSLSQMFDAWSWKSLIAWPWQESFGLAGESSGIKKKKKKSCCTNLSCWMGLHLHGFNNRQESVQSQAGCVHFICVPVFSLKFLLTSTFVPLLYFWAEGSSWCSLALLFDEQSAQKWLIQFVCLFHYAQPSKKELPPKEKVQHSSWTPFSLD